MNNSVLSVFPKNCREVGLRIFCILLSKQMSTTISVAKSSAKSSTIAPPVRILVPTRVCFPLIKKEIQDFKLLKIMWAPEQICGCVDETSFKWAESVIDEYWVDIMVFLTRASEKDVILFHNYITSQQVWPVIRRALCGSMMSFMVQLEAVGIQCSPPLVEFFRWRYEPMYLFACERNEKTREMIGPATELLRGTKRSDFLTKFKELYEKERGKKEDVSVSPKTD